MKLDQYGQWKANISFLDKKVYGRQIVLPLPPSENDRLTVDWQGVKALSGMFSSARKTKRGTVKNTTSYNRYLSASRALLMKGKFERLDGDIGVLITLVFKDNRTHDIDNRVKPLFDCFTKSEHVWHDDRQVKFFTCHGKVIKGKSFVVAFVFRLDDLDISNLQIDEEYLKQISNSIEV